MEGVKPWKDSEYGKLSELFDLLNYEGKRAGSARPYSTLAKKTVDHRKQFIKEVLNRRSNPQPFPLKYDDPDVQRCAAAFLEGNKSTFQAAGASNGGLSYGSHSDNFEIVNILAKIMCNQELSHRKNQHQKFSIGDDGSDREEETDGEPHTLRSKKNTRPRQSMPTNNLDDDDDEEEFEADQAGPKRPPGASNPTKAEGPVDSVLRHNTKVHLDVCYPPLGTLEGTDGSWLLESGSTWPEDCWPFTFRFIHEHQAYRLPRTNHVRNFVAALKEQLHLPPHITKEENDRILKKCGKFMFNWVTKWIKFGLLVQSGEDVVRHSYLEVMLQIYRSKWIAAVHQGMMTAPELQKPALPHMKLGVKRSIPTVHDEAGQGLAGASAKRAKFNPESVDFYNNSTEAESMNGKQGGGPHHGIASFPPINPGPLSNDPSSTKPTSKSATPMTTREGSAEIPHGRTFSFFPENENASLPARLEAGESAPRTGAAPKGPRPWWTGSKPTSRPQSASDMASPSHSIVVEQSGSINGVPKPQTPQPASSERVSEMSVGIVTGLRPAGRASSRASSENFSATSVSFVASTQPSARVSSEHVSVAPVGLAAGVHPPARPSLEPVSATPVNMLTGIQPQANVSTSQPQSQIPQSAVDLPGYQSSAMLAPPFVGSIDNQIPDFVRSVSPPCSMTGAELPKVDELRAPDKFPQPSPSKSSQKPSVPTLKLIIEQAEGEMNFDNPILEADLRSGSVADFFDCVRSRRINPDDNIRALRFKQRWGANKIYVVDRSTSEATWKKVRNEIRRNFEAFKDKRPDRKKFEVNVLVEGDEVDGEDDDDDEDDG